MTIVEGEILEEPSIQAEDPILIQSISISDEYILQ